MPYYITEPTREESKVGRPKRDRTKVKAARKANHR